MMQLLGERISKEEDHAVKQMNTNQSEGTKEIPHLPAYHDRNDITTEYGYGKDHEIHQVRAVPAAADVIKLLHKCTPYASGIFTKAAFQCDMRIGSHPIYRHPLGMPESGAVHRR